MNSIKLGTLVKEKMDEKGISFRVFAEILEMNYRTLHSKCNTGSFTFGEVLRIMEFFDISLEEIKEIIEYQPLEKREWNTHS